jgi:hypothetical protein
LSESSENWGGGPGEEGVWLDFVLRKIVSMYVKT